MLQPMVEKDEDEKVKKSNFCFLYFSCVKERVVTLKFTDIAVQLGFCREERLLESEAECFSDRISSSIISSMEKRLTEDSSLAVL